MMDILFNGPGSIRGLLQDLAATVGFCAICYVLYFGGWAVLG